jgi:hypothetical protein
MNHRSIFRGIPAAFVVAVFTYSAAQAQLPALNDAPWLGHFVGFEGKRFHFGVTSMGKITLNPLNDRDSPIGHKLTVNLEIGILETAPDGKQTLRKIKPETLTSSEPATDDLEKVVIRGKVSGDASFEATIERQRDVILFGGRVLDAGTLKNPLNFGVNVKIPSAYPYDKASDKKEDKSFQKKIEDDLLQIKWTDGKRMRQSFEEEVDAGSKELNGPGIAAAEIEISSYKGKKFLFTANENSAMTISNGKPGPLHLGFELKWQPDPEKDKEGKSRLSLEVK